jgi:MPBQ/MSBQ methyltransferase
MSVDNVLKLYSETIRSSFLHYGFWDNPNEISLESLTLHDLKNAQLRYAEHLCSYIPSDVNSIIDVGCGIGGNADYLLSKGFEVEALSPDNYQKKSY